MSTNVINTSPYLRTSREYPQDDPHQLSVEVNKSYIDIANAVNNRTIGLYPITTPAITGNSYFLKANAKQQTFRQVYTFTTLAAINHGITFKPTTQFTAMYGQFYNGTNWYPLCFSDFVHINNALSFYISPTQIIFVPGNPALPPPVTLGSIILEWIP